LLRIRLAVLTVAASVAALAAVVHGDLTNPARVDLYQVLISDPAAFFATTSFGATAPRLDTMLSLFSSSGYGIVANDDTLNGGSGYDPRSTLPAGSTAALNPGFYLLAVSTYRYAPFDAGGNEIFPTLGYQPVVAASPAAGPLASWRLTDSYSGEINIGPYDLEIRGASFGGARALADAAVPEASTYALAGIGLLVVCIILRRTLRLPPRK
jgi:hypothetical protein